MRESSAMKRLAAVIVCVLLLAGLTAVAAQSQDDGGGGGDKPVTFDVGDPQGIDSMSPLIGVTLAAYEAWNIQYATLTDKAANDFHTIPGLAESWKGSNDGKTWTYKLRDGLKWSDGKPLTAEDIAWTINTSRDEEWINHSATTVNLDAEATDDTTLVVKSKVPDPKLPTMDVYILPKHIWGKMDADERGQVRRARTASARGRSCSRSSRRASSRASRRTRTTGAASRPSTRSCCGSSTILTRWSRRSRPVSSTPRRTSRGPPSTSSRRTTTSRRSRASRAPCREVAINGGDGLKKPHPALLDVKVRQAIGHAIDKKTLVARVLNGHGKPAETLSVSPNPSWTPEIPADQVFDFDLDKARQILEDAGYKDTDDDGVREMPGGGKPLNFTYYVRSDGETGPEIGEFVTGWLKEIGIATTKKVADDSQLTTIIGKGDYDMFAWGWVPFVDPDPMLSYFTCDQVSSDPEDPTNYYNDANYCDPGVRQALRAAEGRARRRTSARRSCTRCSRASSSRAPTTCSTRSRRPRPT